MNTEIISSEFELLREVPILHINALMGHKKMAEIYVALLHTLPTGSHKVLAAKSMIEHEQKKRKITKKTIFVDHSTGNAASAEAWICAAKSLNYVCFVPENMAPEKVQQIKACGGQVHFTPAEEFVAGAKRAAVEYQKQDPVNRIYLNQAANPANAEGYMAIGELFAREFPSIDAYVCGAGTYGTITGVASALKERQPNVMVICIETVYAPHIHGQRKGHVVKFKRHNLIGFGTETLSPNARPQLYDNIVLIDEKTAIKAMKQLHKTGLLVGKTSAANIYWAEQIARKLGPGKTVVTNTFDSFFKITSENIYVS